MQICIKCGAYHGMCLEDMTTGELTPINLCKNCIWYGTYNPITEQIILKEKENLPTFETLFGPIKNTVSSCSETKNFLLIEKMINEKS